MKRHARNRSRANFASGLAQDVRFALRGLRRSPGFTVAATLTLALGIGGNTAIFSVLNSVILRPLPYPDPDRLVQMVERNVERAAAQGWPSANTPVSAHNYEDYRELNTLFEDMGWAMIAGDLGSGVNLTGGDRPVRIKAVTASASLFSTLGVAPLLGRTWLPLEDGFAFEGPRVAILSHRLWTSHFGADREVLGRVVRVDEWPHTVVGVMPPEFDLPPLEYEGTLQSSQRDADLYVPLSYNAFGLSRGARQFTVIGRLREGVNLEQAEAEMNSLLSGLITTYPRANTGWSVHLMPLRELLTRSLGPQLALVMAAAGLVLLIGCANVANLLLARGEGRKPEIALRTALGGGRFRIARQLLTESLVLATAAGGIGVTLAVIGNRVLVSMIPASLPRAGESSIDGSVLAFAMLVTLGTGIIFGLAPAFYSSRADLATAMRGAPRQGSGSRVGGGMSRVLVAGEVAIALVLLVGAGLLARNFSRLSGADLGYEPDHLLRVSLDLGRPNPYNSKYYTCDMDSSDRLLWTRCPRNEEALARFFSQVVQRIERVPGVQSATVAERSPLVDRGGYYPLRIPGTTAPAGSSQDTVEAGERDAEVLIGITSGTMVQPGFFETLGIRIVAGRDFRVGDPSGWTGVAVVNERLAHRAWPGESAVGKRVTFYGGGSWMTVIGVVENVQETNLSDRLRYNDEGLESHVYLLGIMAIMDLIVRTAGDPSAFVEPIRKAVLELDPGLPTGAVATLGELVEASNAAPRFYALMLGIFSGFALLLTAVGLYGLVAFSVGRRTKEIGIRMALGAPKNSIRKMAMGHAAKSVGLGLLVGVTASLALASVMEKFLYAVEALDPLTYGAVAILLTAVASVASYVPSARASRLDPTEALRHD